MKRHFFRLRRAVLSYGPSSLLAALLVRVRGINPALFLNTFAGRSLGVALFGQGDFYVCDMDLGKLRMLPSVTDRIVTSRQVCPPDVAVSLEDPRRPWFVFQIARPSHTGTVLRDVTLHIPSGIALVPDFEGPGSRVVGLGAGGQWSLAARDARKYFSAPRVNSSSGRAVVAIEAFGNYYHWLLEGVPRLLWSVQLANEAELSQPLVLSPERIPSYVRDTLVILRLETRAIRDEFAKVDLLVKSGGPNHAGPTSVSVDTVRRALSRIAPPEGEPINLMVSRRGSTRRWSEEEEAEALLASHGFHIVDPAQLALREQIDLFNRAGIVVAAHGAALANLIWMQRNSTVIELMKDSFLAYSPYFLAQVCGIAHSWVWLDRPNWLDSLEKAVARDRS